MNETREEPTILIVGAGPVGLVAAHRLVWHGCRVRIIDQKPAPTELSKALVLWQRTMETLDASLPFERFQQSRGANLVQGMIAHADKATLGEFSLENRESPIPTGLFLPQSTTEKLLIERLLEQGIEVEWNTSLDSFNATDLGIDYQVRSADGSTSSGQAKWMIGADGAHSQVRHQLGLTFPGDSLEGRWLFADVAFHEAIDPQFGRIFFTRQGGLLVLPAGENRWRLIITAGPMVPDTTAGPPSRDQLQKLLDQHTATGWSIRETFWVSEFVINERIVANYRHGRIFLAGDAAHIHSPAGGQGMNTGIQDAINLAWKLALVARDAAPQTLLDTYHAERHPIGRSILRDSGRGSRMVTTQNFVLHKIRAFAIQQFTRIGVLNNLVRPKLAEIQIHYRNGPLAKSGKAHAKIQPGDRLPNEMEQGRPIYESLRHPGATLLIADQGNREVPTTFGNGAGALPLRTIPIDPSGPLAEKLGLLSGEAVLVRPDAYISTFVTDISSLHDGMGPIG